METNTLKFAPITLKKDLTSTSTPRANPKGVYRIPGTDGDQLWEITDFSDQYQESRNLERPDGNTSFIATRVKSYLSKHDGKRIIIRHPKAGYPATEVSIKMTPDQVILEEKHVSTSGSRTIDYVTWPRT
jgi:hypothetical protein